MFSGMDIFSLATRSCLCIKIYNTIKDMKKFHDALKTIYGPKRSGSTTLLSTE